MYFNSPVFLYLFLPAVLLVYQGGTAVLPGRARMLFANVVLFFASLFFYVWGELEYVLVLYLSLALNYGFARVADWRIRRNRSTRAVAAIAVVANLALLFWFKYAAFALAALSVDMPAGFGEHLPIGISFFTFQAISYVLDVCRKGVPAERSYLKFGLYVFLFPHLIAGPIVRYRDIAAQLSGRPVGSARFAEGVRRLGFGLGKKLLLADTFAEVADSVFGIPGSPVVPAELTATAAWLGVLCYSLQIYFDFSGYSDMAIGLGKMFGFDFLENFHYPYAARSITDFWRRWHISLSSWFRDYVYIPLGGNRRGASRTYLNLLIVFALCGFWHGASWNFLLWGLFHGLFLVVERLGLSRWLDRFLPLFSHAYALLAVACGWVLFRAADLPHAWEIYGAMFARHGTLEFADVWNPKLAFALPVGILVCLPIVPQLERWFASRSARLQDVAASLSLLGVAACYLGASMQLAAKSYSPFIYFRF